MHDIDSHIFIGNELHSEIKYTLYTILFASL